MVFIISKTSFNKLAMSTIRIGKLCGTNDTDIQVPTSNSKLSLALTMVSKTVCFLENSKLVKQA